MTALENSHGRLSGAYKESASKIIEIFSREICIYENKFIHSHVETFNLNIIYS